jgi:hypothetical protein
VGRLVRVLVSGGERGRALSSFSVFLLVSQASACSRLGYASGGQQAGGGGGPAGSAERVAWGCGRRAPRVLQASAPVHHGANHFTQMPCGVCPVARACTEGGVASPANCEYLDKLVRSYQEAEPGAEAEADAASMEISYDGDR